MEFLVLACKKYNQTIVMITHDLNLAGYADRVIEIQDGQIVKDYQTTESNRTIVETDLKAVDKKEILKSAQDKINNAVFEPEIDEEIEGKNSEGNYVIDNEQMMQALISIYNIDIRLAQNKQSEKVDLSMGLKKYFEWMKASIEEGKAVELYNTRRQKVMEKLEGKEAIISYIESLEKKRMLTTQRKNDLVAYFNDK